MTARLILNKTHDYIFKKCCDKCGIEIVNIADANHSNSYTLTIDKPEQLFYFGMYFQMNEREREQLELITNKK